MRCRRSSRAREREKEAKLQIYTLMDNTYKNNSLQIYIIRSENTHQTGYIIITTQKPNHLPFNFTYFA